MALYITLPSAHKAPLSKVSSLLMPTGTLSPFMLELSTLASPLSTTPSIIALSPERKSTKSPLFTSLTSQGLNSLILGILELFFTLITCSTKSELIFSSSWAAFCVALVCKNLPANMKVTSIQAESKYTCSEPLSIA